jgi:hypothetical protein
MMTADITRRKIVAGLGAGVVMSAAPALAMAADTKPQEKTTGFPPVGLEDPRGKYPKPPFKEQSQPWPGLASKMNPRPDHGEKTYRGSGRLAGRKALITGGDSGMGRAAAIAYVREGADVVINYLPAEEEDAQEVLALIKAENRRGFGIPGDLRNETFCQQLVEQAVHNLGGLDIVVNNAARQQTRASLLDITTEDFDATIKTNIYAPFWVSRAALPHLKTGLCHYLHGIGTGL